MHKQSGDEIQIVDMNHINDPSWAENLIDIKLSGVQEDINLKKNWKPAKPPAKSNVMLSDEINDQDLVNLVETDGTLETEEGREIADKLIKIKGDRIAKENIVKRENMFVQQQVTEVLHDIAAFKEN